MCIRDRVWHMTGGHVERVGNICFSTFTDANFVMVQLGNPEIELFRGSKEPFKGWNCPAYDHMVAAPEINASLYGRQAVFETLVLPVPVSYTHLEPVLYVRALCACRWHL